MCLTIFCHVILWNNRTMSFILIVDISVFWFTMNQVENVTQERRHFEIMRYFLILPIKVCGRTTSPRLLNLIVNCSLALRHLLLQRQYYSYPSIVMKKEVRKNSASKNFVHYLHQWRLLTAFYRCFSLIAKEFGVLFTIKHATLLVFIWYRNGRGTWCPL